MKTRLRSCFECACWFALHASGVSVLGAQTDTVRASPSPVRARTASEDLQMFGQVLNQIRVNHPDSIDTHALLMAAIAGMVHAADPHSYVIPATRLEPGKEAALRSGNLVPLPIEFVFVGGAPIVASVAAGSAASKQDILPGDELVSVNGRPVIWENAVELQIALAGSKGSEVAAGFERRRQDGSIGSITRVVKRETVSEATAVPVATMLDASTGYVRITTFAGERVASDMHDALVRLEKQGLTRLVLDLRDNGGGSLAEAARVSSEFLPKGAIVYTATGSRASLTDTVRVSRTFWSSERRYPIVLMINAGTASASELVAGALQDHDRAIVVGMPSFGKSLMMRQFPLADGSTIVLVVGRVQTPCGRVVQREYRGISRREYYRLAGADRDTAGRPSCRTDAGRVVFGGGGIYPDVRLFNDEMWPAWAERLSENSLIIQWVGSWVDSHESMLTSLDDFAQRPSLPLAALHDFRAFAAEKGIAIPSSADADVRVQQLLVPAVANAKWGDAGWYRLSAVLDPQVASALAVFAKSAPPR